MSGKPKLDHSIGLDEAVAEFVALQGRLVRTFQEAVGLRDEMDLIRVRGTARVGVLHLDGADWRYRVHGLGVEFRTNLKRPRIIDVEDHFLEPDVVTAWRLSKYLRSIMPRPILFRGSPLAGREPETLDPLLAALRGVHRVGGRSVFRCAFDVSSGDQVQPASIDEAPGWARLEQWLRVHRPESLTCLAPPAADAELNAAEEQLQRKLPTALRSLLMKHNGQRRDLAASFLGRWRLLDVFAIVELWKQHHANPGPERWGTNRKSKTAIKQVGWNDAWYPALIGTGDLLCIDQAPGRSGSQGQLILRLREDPYLVWVAASLDDFFGQVAADYDSKKGTSRLTEMVYGILGEP